MNPVLTTFLLGSLAKLRVGSSPRNVREQLITLLNFAIRKGYGTTDACVAALNRICVDVYWWLEPHQIPSDPRDWDHYLNDAETLDLRLLIPKKLKDGWGVEALHSSEVLCDPSEEDFRIWRYLDPWKLEDLLERRSLYFTRADRFSDTAEGTYTWATESEWGSSEIAADMAMGWRRCIGVTCWHINEAESLEMWSRYLRDSEGVAIQTRFSRLDEALDRSSRFVYLGRVQYVDEDFEMSYSHALSPFFYKRKRYQWETELRGAILIEPPLMRSRRIPWGVEPDFDASPIDHGFHEPVDMHCLIESVWISPLASVAFERSVSRLLKKCGVHAEVVPSRLMPQA